MADLTPDLNICLQGKGAQPILTKIYDLTQVNSFLQEAYSINARISDLTRELRSIRRAYLSNATARRRQPHGSQNNTRTQPLTDSERDAIDAQSKQLLRQLNGAITSLKQAEEVRLQTADSVALSKRARGGLGAIGRWAAGGAVTAKSPEEEREEAERKTIAAHRESVILYLQWRLEGAGRVQGEMMEVRLGREVEKSKSALYKSRAGAAGAGIPYASTEGNMDDFDGAMLSSPTSPSAAAFEHQSGHTGAQAESTSGALSQEQLQLFAEENADLLKHYEDQLDQVRAAERSILEISELHSTLHSNLAQQSDHIDQLVQDSYLTTENLGKGNKQLKRASERRSTAQAVFWGTVGFCSFLVVWDLIF